MLTDFDVAELAGVIPDDYFDVKPPPIISPDELRALYTAQSFHEAEIDAREGVIAWCATNHYYRHFETHQKLIDFIQGSPPATRSWSERIYAAQPKSFHETR